MAARRSSPLPDGAGKKAKFRLVRPQHKMDRGATPEALIRRQPQRQALESGFLGLQLTSLAGWRGYVPLRAEMRTSHSCGLYLGISTKKQGGRSFVGPARGRAPASPLGPLGFNSPNIAQRHALAL